MSYSSPTIIYKLDLLQGFVSVCDVSGTYATQIYRSDSSGWLRLLHSETWSTAEDAISCASAIFSNESENWWSAEAPNLETVEDWRDL